MKDEKTTQPKLAQYSVPVAILGLLLVLRVIYLAVEYFYNVSLLEFSSQPLILERQASEIERNGHRLAATGMTLLLAPFLILFFHRIICRSTRKVVSRIAFVCITVATSTLLYLGSYKAQDELMAWLIRESSPQARFDAYYLNVLRALLADGTVRHDGIVKHPPRSFEDKLILGTLPVALYGQSELIESIRSQGKTVILARARKQALMERFPTHWQAYTQYQAKLHELWGHYASFHLKNKDLLQGATENALQIYGMTIKKLHDLYPQYQKQSLNVQRRFNEKWSNERLSQFGSKLSRILKMPANAPTKNWDYDALMRQYFGRAIPMSVWCGDEACNLSMASIRESVQALERGQFQEMFYGVRPGLTEKQFFENANAVNSVLAAGGVPMSLSTKEPVTLRKFIATYKNAVFSQARTQLNDAIKTKTGWQLSLPLELTYEEFMNTPDFRQLATRQIGFDMEGIALNLDQEGFFKAWSAVANKSINKTLERLIPSSPKAFERADMQAIGEAAIKLGYVIPFALVLSAIMAFLNTVTLLASLWKPVRDRVSNRAGIAGTAAIWAVMLLVFLAHPNDLGAGRHLVGSTISDMGTVQRVTVSAFVSLERTVAAVGGGIKAILPARLEKALDTRFGL